MRGGVAGEDVGGDGAREAGVHGADGVDGGDVAAQAVVGDEQVDVAGVGDGHDHGLVGGGGAEDVVTPDAEHAAHGGEHLLVVVDDEHAQAGDRTGGRRVSCTGGGVSAGGSQRGTRMLNMEPRPGVERRSSGACSRRAERLTMDRPRPRPWDSWRAAGVWPIWKNSSKMASRCSLRDADAAVPDLELDLVCRAGGSR